MQGLNGVWMVQGCVAPMLEALQSQKPLSGVHWWNVLVPTIRVWQLEPLGHAMVEQSRAQNLRPSASARHRSREAAEHSLSLWQGVQRRVELGTHTSLTTPGSMAPVTPRQPQPIGQLPAVQTREHTPPAPVKM